MRDRLREAEQPRAQRVHVDRIAVAGDRAVPPPQVAGQPPLRRPATSSRLRRARAAGARPHRCHRRDGAWCCGPPTPPRRRPTRSTKSKRPTLRMGLDRGGAHGQVERLADQRGRCTTMRLLRCTNPTAGNGKRPSVISSMCIGNALTCRYVAGSASRSVKPQTRAYVASAAPSRTPCAAAPARASPCRARRRTAAATRRGRAAARRERRRQ